MTERPEPAPVSAAEVFTPEQVQNLHRHQFGPFDPMIVDGNIGGGFTQMHPFTCPNRGDGHHFDNGSDLGALVPTVRGWICQSCDYTQSWAHEFMLTGRRVSAP